MEEGGLSCEAASLSYEEVVESGQDDEEEMEEGRDIGEGVEGVGPNQVEGDDGHNRTCVAVVVVV